MFKNAMNWVRERSVVLEISPLIREGNEFFICTFTEMYNTWHSMTTRKLKKKHCTQSQILACCELPGKDLHLVSCIIFKENMEFGTKQIVFYKKGIYLERTSELILSLFCSFIALNIFAYIDVPNPFLKQKLEALRIQCSITVD